MNLHNVSGESIKCYFCASDKNNKCADPIDKSGLEPVECKASILDDAASAVRDGLNAFGNVLGMTDIPRGSDLKYVCRKMDISGKKF
jgi:hypothetical protein